MYQLSPFDVGQIKAHLHHGLSGAAISRTMVKPDGKSEWSEQAMQDAMRKLEEQPSWRGERVEGSGAGQRDLMRGLQEPRQGESHSSVLEELALVARLVFGSLFRQPSKLKTLIFRAGSVRAFRL